MFNVSNGLTNGTPAIPIFPGATADFRTHCARRRRGSNPGRWHRYRDPKTQLQPLGQKHAGCCDRQLTYVLRHHTITNFIRDDKREGDLGAMCHDFPEPPRLSTTFLEVTIYPLILTIVVVGVS